LIKLLKRLVTTISSEHDRATAAILKSTIFFLRKYRSQRNNFNIALIVNG